MDNKENLINLEIKNAMSLHALAPGGWKFLVKISQDDEREELENPGIYFADTDNPITGPELSTPDLLNHPIFSIFRDR